MINVGTLLRCKTLTENEIFGDVVWEVVETGLQAPEKGRESQIDGVKVVLLGGSGIQSRAGITLIDSEEHLSKDMTAGITSIISVDEKDTLLTQYKDRPRRTLPS